MKKRGVCAFFALLTAAVLCLSGCSGPPPEVLSIRTKLDPSVAASDIEDPYAEMDRYAKELFEPDRELYNLLYRAVDEMKPSVDISSFKVNSYDLIKMLNCLITESGFYYLKSVKLSANGKKALITCNADDAAGVRRNKELFYGRLSHLVYNVAPDGYTDLQKVMAVYQYLCENSNYSGNMQDQTTYWPYSILMKGQGICNGFARLADYVLNRIGVPTEYVANDIHAWNIVTVNGKRYHMDITFGTQSYGSTANALNTVLMDDNERKENLSFNNVDEGEMIVGYPQENTKRPQPCTDADMTTYKDIYYIYALDIDNGKVYYADNEGVLKRMNLDCTGAETVSTTATPFEMEIYDGVLYYLGGYGPDDKSQLYRLNEDGTADLLDETKYLGYLHIVNGTLRYSLKYDGSEYKTIKLSDFDPSAWDGAETEKLSSLSVPKAGALP